MERRDFLKTATAAAGAAATEQLLTPMLKGAEVSAAGDRPKAEIPKRILGSTGERISAIGLGGYHLGRPGLH